MEAPQPVCPTLTDGIVEHVLLLWKNCEDERREMKLEEEQGERFDFWAFDRISDQLAGWCSQVSKTGNIRPSEIGEFQSVPRLDRFGPFKGWLESLEGNASKVRAWASAIEVMRMILVRELSLSGRTR